MTGYDKGGPGEKSGLWELVAPSMTDAVAHLSSFRSPGGANSRLAHWEPRESTLRWFRSYLQVAAGSMAVEDLRLLAAIGDMNIGQPVTVVIEMPAPATPIEVSLDYVFAAEEFGFLRRAVLPAELSELSVVVELGAGFGRTAHLLLTHLRTIETYVIVDLPETLSLSRAYLHAALPEWLWSKLVFMDAEALEQGRCVFQEGVDLAIQIDGFQEMSPESIDGYFVEIIDHARLVFLSNPVGKYRPEVAGIVDVDPKVLAEVAKLGRCRGLLDPWDARDLAAVRRDYIDAYKPMGFEVVATEPSRLRPFYQHTLYRSPRSEGRAH